MEKLSKRGNVNHIISLGEQQIRLFATCKNYKMPTNVSPMPDQKT